jgi:hypothetical protein
VPERDRYTDHGSRLPVAGKTLNILAAWVREGDPGTVVAEIARDASLSIGTELRLIAPPSHFRPYDTIGLAPAVRRLPTELHRGGDVTRGRGALRALLAQQTQGRPALQVSAQASWVVNGFAAGYARAMDARAARNASGVPVTEEASDGVYACCSKGWRARWRLGFPPRAMRMNVTDATPSPPMVANI